MNTQPSANVIMLRDALATLLSASTRFEYANAMSDPHEYRRALYAVSVARFAARKLLEESAKPQRCQHDWPMTERGHDMNGLCLRCAKSWRQYINEETREDYPK